MVVQEIFNLSAIKEIEEMILYHQWKIEHARGSYETNKKLIKRLIEIRQILLDREFVMNEYHKGLLGEFNDAMRAQLVKMRLETIKAYHVAEATGLGGEIEAIGKCYLGYRYSKFHPVQTIRAKKMWAVLNGTLDDYVDLYGDGVITNGWSYRGGEPESEDTMLYLDEKLDNWNNGFDREQTKDMHQSI